MHRPVLVAAPADLPLSQDEAKKFVIVEAAEDEETLMALVGAATEHLDGWTGILGRCLVQQDWRQDFDRFDRCIPLALRPVRSIVSVTWRSSGGQIHTIAQDNYSLRTDAGGSSHVRFKNDFVFPGDLNQVAAVSITYRAGDPVDEMPKPLKTAIGMLAAQWFNNREATVTGTIATQLPLAVDALIRPFRRGGI
jgi:uncharacterized phiE125 gp8 family phage protein